MPTYEYECSAGHRYEKREGFDAPPSQRCLKCRRIARRVIHAPRIVFKGSGFYVTDSRKPAPSEAEGSAPAADSEAKTESQAGKPATKDKASTKDAEAAAAS